jgi:TonB family protein
VMAVFTVELLLSLAVKSTLILVGAALVAASVYRASAAARHVVWAAALAALLLLPLAGGVGLAWRPPLPEALAAVPAQAATVLDVVAQPPGLRLSTAAVAWWVWAIGLVVLLSRTAAGLRKIGRMFEDAQPLAGHGPGVWLSGQTPVPVVCGFWRPRVVLPESALSWPAARLRMVLTHERMHIARHDTRTYLMARLAGALYWPNPLVWWAVNRLRREAERACDDGVLMQGARASAYAGALVEIVQGLETTDRLPEGGLAMGRVSELESRLKALLNSGLNRRKATPLLIAGVSLLSLVILLPLAAFQAPAPQGGGIWGVVRDASGALVPKARVTVALVGSQRKEFAVTPNTGQFAMQPLPEGTYTVEVAKPGFAKLGLQGIVVKPGQMTEVQTILSVGQVSETMEVKAERPAPVAMPQGSPQRVEQGGNVQATKLVHAERPAYPPDCKAEGVEGTVLLRAVIGVDGNILNLQQVNQLVDPRLAAAATEAVRQWRYQPTLLNGNPVEVATDIQINFALSN